MYASTPRVESEPIYELGEGNYATFLFEKTLRETTEPHAGWMLDVRSQQFKALTAAASEEFFAAIEYTQNGDGGAVRCSCGGSTEQMVSSDISVSYP